MPCNLVGDHVSVMWDRFMQQFVSYERRLITAKGGNEARTYVDTIVPYRESGSKRM